MVVGIFHHHYSLSEEMQAVLFGFRIRALITWTCGSLLPFVDACSPTLMMAIAKTIL